MALSSTVRTTWSGDFGSTLALPIASLDRSGFVTKATNYFFDALNPSCYVGGALPTIGAAIPDAGLVNLAIDVQPFLTDAGLARGAITAVPYTTSVKPTFDGKGLVFNTTNKNALIIKNAALADNRVDEPALEGFIDYVETLCLREGATFASGSSPRAAGQNATNKQNRGWQHGGAIGQYFAYPINVNGSQIAVDGAPHTLTNLYRYNVGANTSTVRSYKDGVLIGTTASLAPASHTANNAAARSVVGGIGQGGGSDVTIHALTGTYVGLLGWSDTDVDGYVAKFDAYLRPRFT